MIKAILAWLLVFLISFVVAYLVPSIAKLDKSSKYFLLKLTAFAVLSATFSFYILTAIVILF